MKIMVENERNVYGFDELHNDYKNFMRDINREYIQKSNTDIDLFNKYRKNRDMYIIKVKKIPKKSIIDYFKKLIVAHSIKKYSRTWERGKFEQEYVHVLSKTYKKIAKIVRTYNWDNQDTLEIYIDEINDLIGEKMYNRMKKSDRIYFRKKINHVSKEIQTYYEKERIQKEKEKTHLEEQKTIQKRKEFEERKEKERIKKERILEEERKREEERLKKIRTKIMSTIKEVSLQYPRLQIVEICELSTIDDENLVTSVLLDLISREEVYAKYFESTKSVVFNQMGNIELMKELDNEFSSWKDEEELKSQKS